VVGQNGRDQHYVIVAQTDQCLGKVAALCRRLWRHWHAVSARGLAVGVDVCVAAPAERLGVNAGGDTELSAQVVCRGAQRPDEACKPAVCN
jgi:hypothetical protein